MAFVVPGGTCWRDEAGVPVRVTVGCAGERDVAKTRARTKGRTEAQDALAAVEAREVIVARVLDAVREARVSWDQQDVVAGVRAVVNALKDARATNKGLAADVRDLRNILEARDAEITRLSRLSSQAERELVTLANGDRLHADASNNAQIVQAELEAIREARDGYGQATDLAEARQALEEATARRAVLEGEVQALRQAVTTAQQQLEALRAEASALWSDRDRLRQSYAAAVIDLQAAQRAAWARPEAPKAEAS